MNRVAVLMSTYNGVKYLKEQMDSILTQEGVDVTLFIRDDGSSDGTIDILKEYVETYKNIILNVGDNLGVGNSFMQLVYDCPDDYDYYAFADQDDIWLGEKLKKAVSKIGEETQPVLYCSNQILVDKDLKTIGMRYSGALSTSYMQILFGNKFAGCTMVWNRPLQKILSDEKRRPSMMLLRNRIHDVWVAMVASVVGLIIYDEDSCILYRQHENNVVGVKKENITKEWRKKILQKELRNGRSKLASEIYSKFLDIMIDDKEMRDNLELCATYKDTWKKKIKLLKNKELRNCSTNNELLYNIKILLNLF